MDVGTDQLTHHGVEHLARGLVSDSERVVGYANLGSGVTVATEDARVSYSVSTTLPVVTIEESALSGLIEGVTYWKTVHDVATLMGAGAACALF